MWDRRAVRAVSDRSPVPINAVAKDGESAVHQADRCPLCLTNFNDLSRADGQWQ